MKIITFILLFTCYSCSWAHKHTPISLDYEQHITHFNSVRNPTVEQGMEWKHTRDYIKTKFREASLSLKVQTYNTTVSSIADVEVSVVGENIIGISEGKNKGKDHVIVVAADYDTMQAATSPIQNNGGGVAALIEIAFAYNERVRSDDYIANSTVIFVAFDLNTKEHYPSKGRRGSDVFVKDWLLSYLQNDMSRFRGAIILDEITNINLQNNSQTMETGSKKYLKGAFETVKQHMFKGDFIAMYTHWDELNDDVATMYSNLYNKKKIMRRFRLQEFALSPPMPGDAEWERIESVIKRTSQYPFWDHRLPAILLTDTGLQRVDACNERCRPVDYVRNDRKEFLDATSVTVVETLLKLQATHLMKDDNGDGNTSSNISPSYLASLLVVAIAYVLR